MLALIALVAIPAVAGAQVPFGTIASAQSGQRLILNAKTLLVNSPEELADAWRQTGRNDSPPPVDFQNHSVVFYFSGARSSSGYELEALNVSHRGGALLLTIRETIPGPGCGTLSVATFPYVAIETTPWKRQAEAEVTQVPRSCAP
jgi:hypothetical protein